MKSSFLIFSLFAYIPTTYYAHCQTTRNAITLNPFVSGLTSPVSIANAGDNRLFVVNQRGSVFLVDSAGNVNPAKYN